MDERAEFERAFSTGDDRTDQRNFHRGGILRCPESYTQDRIEALWEGWQAARKFSAKEPQP